MALLKVAAGVALVTTIGEPPPTGVAVNVKLVQGPPVVGGVAVAVPWVGPVASADVRAGAVAAGMVRSMGLDGGVLAPEAVVATTDTSYVSPGARPAMGQLVGEGQVTTMGAPPPFGTAVKVKEENGPPILGGDAVRLAVFDEVGVVEAILGPLQCILMENSEVESPSDVLNILLRAPALTQQVASPAEVRWMVDWPSQTRLWLSP